MDSRQLMDLLCDCRRSWRLRREQIHADALYYPAIAELGHELVRTVQAGQSRKWTTRAFEVLERGFEEGDDQAKNLIVVGMFEAIQNDAYQKGPPEQIENCLGPLSLKAWADLIEGWTGEGIRTVEHWRRVVRNGPITRFRFQSRSEERALACEVGEPSKLLWSSGSKNEQRTLDEAELKRYLAPLWPLVATKLLPVIERSEPWAVLEIESPRDKRTISIGRALGRDRVCSDGERAFLIDVDALLRSWPELGRSK